MSLMVKNASKHYDDLEVLNNINLELMRGDKIAFVGKNGEGKSTLAKMIVNEINFDGDIELGYQVRVGYYAQNQAEFLSENLNLQVIVVDLRNHGSSFWSDNHDYISMARDLIELCKNFSKKVTILGHSMGGKAAMYACLSYPEIFDKLIVVDISPVNYLNSEFVNYIEILQSIDLTKIQSRKDADLELESKIVDKNIRSFLLQNLFLNSFEKLKALYLQVLN